MTQIFYPLTEKSTPELQAKLSYLKGYLETAVVKFYIENAKEGIVEIEAELARRKQP